MKRWGLVLGLTLPLLLAAAGAVEVRRIESVGAVPAGADAPRGVPIREAAVQMALRDAVTRVAVELAGLHGGGLESGFEGLFDASPSDYVVRYRLSEDRGERRPLLVQDPAVTSEYIVVVLAHVDVARVRQRLVDEGLLVVSPTGGDSQRVVLVLEGLRSYPALAALQARLRSDPAVHRAVPEEFQPDLAALAVETTRTPTQLLDTLLAEPPVGFEIVPLREESGRLWLRLVEIENPSPPRADGAAARSPGRLRD